MGTVKVDGQQRKLVGAWMKADGSWRKVNEVNAKENGLWKSVWKNNFPAPDFISYPSLISRNQSITITTEDIVGASYLLQTRYNSGEWDSGQVFATNSFQVQVSSNISHNTLQYRVAAVEPVTLDKQSAWTTGVVRSISPEKLAQPTGFSYAALVTRGNNIRIDFYGIAGTNYHINAIYKNASGGYNESLAFSVPITTTGATSKVFTASTSTDWTILQFKIVASKNGYTDSDPLLGIETTLGLQTIGNIANISYPLAYSGQTITISWDAAALADRYQLEVLFTGEQWTRLYWGQNRTFTWSVVQKGAQMQFRVRGTRTNYIDGNWKYGPNNAMQPKPLKSSTWNATLTESWRPNFGGQYHPDNNYVYQGGWNDGTYWGDYTGLVFFDFNNIRTTLADKTIEKVQLYFYRINSGGYNSGQAINLHTHNYSSLPLATAGRPAVSHVQGPFSSYARGEGKWITVSKAVVDRIVAGTATGIALYNGSSNYLYMSSNVKLYVEYR